MCSNKSVLMLNGNGFCFGNLLEFCDVVTYPFPVILLVKGYIYFDKHAVVKNSTSFIYEYNHLVKWVSLKQR